MTGVSFQALLMASSGASVTLTDNAVDSTVLTTYTYTSKAIGSALVGRIIIVAVDSPGNGSSRTISSVTCGGVTMNAVASSFVEGTGGAQFSPIGLFSLQVDTGTTATIVVTWSGAMSRSGIGVFAAYGLSSGTATAAATSTANPGTNSINVSAGGVLVAAACVFHTATAITFTWTNLTERYDAQFSSSNVGHTGASDSFGSAQTSLAVTATATAFTAGAFTMAAFR